MSVPATLRTTTPELWSRCSARKRPRLEVCARRKAHSLPPLPALSEGLDPFLKRGALQVIWNEYQGGLLRRLNDVTRNTPEQHSSLVDTVIQTASDRSKILTFNYASEALNNAFFLSKLRRSPTPLNETSELAKRLTADFSSTRAFQHHFSSAAMGIMGSGWLWLVADAYASLSVIGSYGPGTMLVQGREQRGETANLRFHLPSPRDRDDDGDEDERPPPRNPSGSQSLAGQTIINSYNIFAPNKDQSRRLSTSAIRHAALTGGPTGYYGYEMDHEAMPKPRDKDALFPLLCMSIHEHAWMPDYGVWGKQGYATNFWQVVDWPAVERTYAELKDLRERPPEELQPAPPTSPASDPDSEAFD